MAVMNTEELDMKSLDSVPGTEGISATDDNGGTLYLEDGIDFPIWLHFAMDQNLIEMFTYRAADPQNIFFEQVA